MCRVSDAPSPFKAGCNTGVLVMTVAVVRRILPLLLVLQVYFTATYGCSEAKFNGTVVAASSVVVAIRHGWCVVALPPIPQQRLSREHSAPYQPPASLALITCVVPLTGVPCSALVYEEDVDTDVLVTVSDPRTSSNTNRCVSCIAGTAGTATHPGFCVCLQDPGAGARSWSGEHRCAPSFGETITPHYAIRSHDA